MAKRWNGPTCPPEPAAAAMSQPAPPPASDANRYRWWILAIATATQLAAALASQGIGAWAPHAQQALQFSNRDLGLLATLLNGAAAAALLLVGPMLDRFGERLPVFLGMAVMGVALLVLGDAAHYATLALAMLIAGLGYSPIQPAGGKAIYQWFPPRERGLAMGIRQAALPMGGACAAAFFPFMIGHAGWHAAMLAAASILVAAGLIYLTLFRCALGPCARPRHTAHHAPAALPRQTSLRRLGIVGMAMVGVQTVISVFWALLVHHRFGLSTHAAAWHLFALQLGGAAGRLAISAISDHLHDGRRRMVRLCALMTGCALLTAIALPTRGHDAMMLACSVAIGVFGFGWYGPWVVWLSDCAGPRQIGRVLASALAANQLIIAAVPLAFGALLDALPDPAPGWLALAGLLAVAMRYSGMPETGATESGPSPPR
ncbi:MFS family transporter [Bordetella ansorpii]|uniref:MFS family transporter n=2 Tax=Bordetella ansorpii TaxID=288768 RepID=A0A157SRJ5_9BORD|nr:MFS family transporter [Bordetella ansorpii]